MSSTYTGNASNVTPASAVDVTIAADGDAITAAARNVSIQENTDYIAFLKRATYAGDYSTIGLEIDGVGNQLTGRPAGTMRVYGSSGNQTAIRGDGSGTGAGVRGVGGASSGVGVQGDGGASNGIGGSFTGDGTGSGVVGTGGDSNGTGVVGIGGTTNGKGGVFTGTGTGLGVHATSGGIQSDGSYDVTSGQDVIATRALQSNDSQFETQAVNTPGAQSINPGRGFKGMIPFAAARVDISGGPPPTNYTLTRAANVNTVVNNAVGNWTVTLLSGVGVGEYLIPSVIPFSNTANAVFPMIDTGTAPTATTFTIQFVDAAGVAADPQSGFYFSVVGG